MTKENRLRYLDAIVWAIRSRLIPLMRTAILTCTLTMATQANALDVFIPKTLIDNAVRKQFPHQFQKGMWHVSLSNPRLSLKASGNTIDFGSDIAAKSKPLSGHGDFWCTAKLRYDAGTRKFFLDEPEVSTVKIKRFPRWAEKILAKLLTNRLENKLKNRPVYELPRDSLPVAVLKISAVTVQTNGILVKLF